MDHFYEYSWGDVTKVTEIESEAGMYVYVTDMEEKKDYWVYVQVDKMAEQSRTPKKTLKSDQIAVHRFVFEIIANNENNKITLCTDFLC